ncbi:hypothetical protein L7F22_021647 [Adiantum nelumboides]|nr:hypothetical protein [Adiantum nelumboides]
MGPDLQMVEDPAHFKKKEKRKEKKKNAHRINAEIVQKDSVDTESVQLNVVYFSGKEKGNLKKFASTNGEIEAVANGLEQVYNGKKKRKSESRECEISHNKKSKDHEEKRKQKKKEKILDAQEHLAEEVQVDDFNQRIPEDDAKLQINVSGMNAFDEKFKPLESFMEVRAPEMVMKCCSGFKKPSPIQAYAWPFLLDGRDLVGIAATGSGTLLSVGFSCCCSVMQ